MILKIYLIISLLTLFVVVLTNTSVIHRAKQKINDVSKNKDNAGLIAAYLKLVIISFMPVVNIFFLLVFIFCGSEIDKRANKIIDDAADKQNNK